VGQHEPHKGGTWADTWRRFVADHGSTKRFLIGASVLRIVAGFTILVQYLVNYAQRRYLYGPEGVYPWEVFADRAKSTLNFSIYAWSQSPLYFEVCFHLGVIVATLWALGWRTRWTTPLNFVFWWSLQHRFSGLWDGGDNLMRIVLIYAMFADVGAYFSLDARRRTAAPGGNTGPSSAGAAEAGAPQASVMLHNAAMLAIALQLCLLYGIAGLSKVQGETWREGTALYYAMRGGQYVWPGFSDAIYQNAYLIVFLSYSTVAFQVSFPFLMFMSKYTRRFAICISLLFHLGIMLFMGLITFSCFMISVDLALVSDDEYTALMGWLHRTGERLRLLGRGAVVSS
jgi:Vitamin K-dependent gamma-carboxylase